MYRLHLKVNGESARRRGWTVRSTLSLTKYIPKRYDGRVMVVRPQTRPDGTHSDAAFGWRTKSPHPNAASEWVPSGRVWGRTTITRPSYRLGMYLVSDSVRI